MQFFYQFLQDSSRYINRYNTEHHEFNDPVDTFRLELANLRKDISLPVNKKIQRNPLDSQNTLRHTNYPPLILLRPNSSQSSYSYSPPRSIVHSPTDQSSLNLYPEYDQTHTRTAPLSLQREVQSHDPIRYTTDNECIQPQSPGVIQFLKKVNPLELRSFLRPGGTFFLFDLTGNKTKIRWGTRKDGEMDYINTSNEHVSIKEGYTLVDPLVLDQYEERELNKQLNNARVNPERITNQERTSEGNNKLPYRYVACANFANGGCPGYVTPSKRFSMTMAQSQLRHLYNQGFRHIITLNGETKVGDAARSLRNEGINIHHELINPSSSEGMREAGLRIASLTQQGIKVYVHCTWGCHRAPAASALGLMYRGARSWDEARNSAKVDMSKYNDKLYGPGCEKIYQFAESHGKKIYNRPQRSTEFKDINSRTRSNSNIIGAPINSERALSSPQRNQTEQVQRYGSVKEISSMAEFESEVLQSSSPVVVDYYGTFCGPCKAFLPKLTKFAKKNDQIKVLKVDVQKCRDVAKKYKKARGVPVFQFFKEGELLHQSASVSSIQSLEDICEDEFK